MRTSARLAYAGGDDANEVKIVQLKIAQDKGAGFLFNNKLLEYA